MTRPKTEDVATMEAGPEIEVLVAVHIMGWRRITIDDPLRFEVERGGYVCGDRAYRFVHGLHSPMWRPSTVMEAAWHVVEKLGQRFHARIKTPFEPGLPYHVGFTPHGVTGWNGRPDFRADAPTAPLAICRAALIAGLTEEAR